MGAFIALGLLSSTEAIKVGRAAFFLSITIYLCAFGALGLRVRHDARSGRARSSPA